MKCEKLKELIPDMLANNLNAEILGSIDKHLTECENCQLEVENLRLIWNKLELIPEDKPGPALKIRFDAMLEAYEQGLQKSSVKPKLIEIIDGWLRKWWPQQPLFQLGYAVTLLFIGLFFGYQIKSGVDANGNVARLQSELHKMKQTVTLSLLKQQSAGDRIQGVSLSTKLSHPDTEVVQSLINILNVDPNINVRIAAIDALFLFTDHQNVRQELVKSLSQQRSPLVQIALIDLLVTIREKRSLEAFKQLITNDKLNQTVKQRAEWGIEQL